MVRVRVRVRVRDRFCSPNPNPNQVVGLTNASRVGKRGRSKGGGAADSERAEGGKKRGGKKRLLDMVADDLQKVRRYPSPLP